MVEKPHQSEVFLSKRGTVKYSLQNRNSEIVLPKIVTVNIIAKKRYSEILLPKRGIVKILLPIRGTVLCTRNRGTRPQTLVRLSLNGITVLPPVICVVWSNLLTCTLSLIHI